MLLNKYLQLPGYSGQALKKELGKINSLVIRINLIKKKS